jgi:hypothetical protein
MFLVRAVECRALFPKITFVEEKIACTSAGLGKMIRNPRLLSPRRWVEYLLSSTYYFVGWAFLVLLICPLFYLFFDIPRYFAHPDIFFVFFVPYLSLTMLAFMNTLRAKSYRRVDMYNGLLLANVTFPVYMQASLLGVLGFRGKFGITPKSGSSSPPAAVALAPASSHDRLARRGSLGLEPYLLYPATGDGSFRQRLLVSIQFLAAFDHVLFQPTRGDPAGSFCLR